jgi:hypothetical protein
VPGRELSIRTAAREQRTSRRILALLAALALVATGVAIGSRIASPPGSAAPAAETGSSRTGDLSTAGRPAPAPPAATPAGAVAAAAQSITAFDGAVLLEPAHLRALVARVASVASRARLIEAFNQASALTRAKLGADTIPKPAIVLRSVPVGYRIERFSGDKATIAVWYVGIVGSGATVEPQQSWRTQIVTVVWENQAWKVSSFASSPGPTPPLSAAAVAQPPGELFATIPHFEEFGHAEP